MVYNSDYRPFKKRGVGFYQNQQAEGEEIRLPLTPSYYFQPHQLRCQYFPFHNFVANNKQYFPTNFVAPIPITLNPPSQLCCQYFQPNNCVVSSLLISSHHQPTTPHQLRFSSHYFVFLHTIYFSQTFFNNPSPSILPFQTISYVLFFNKPLQTQNTSHLTNHLYSSPWVSPKTNFHTLFHTLFLKFYVFFFDAL